VWAYFASTGQEVSVSPRSTPRAVGTRLQQHVWTGCYWQHATIQPGIQSIIRRLAVTNYWASLIN